MPDTTNARAHSSQPTRVAVGQQPEPEQRALDFLAKVVRVPGVRVNREEFLRQELRKLHMGDDAIQRAIDSNPLLAGVSLTAIDRLADEAISYETNKSAAISFVAGIPRRLRDARHDPRGPDAVLRARAEDHAKARLPVRLGRAPPG